MGPDEEELSFASVVASATLLPGCAFTARSILVNIAPSMGKKAALYYLTRGSVSSIWVPVAIFVLSVVARKTDDWRVYAFASVAGAVGCILSVMKIDLHPAAVFLAVSLCSVLAAVKTRGA